MVSNKERRLVESAEMAEMDSYQLEDAIYLLSGFRIFLLSSCKTFTFCL
jgi:hypothetical protein